MKIAIHQPHYCPWLGYMDKMAKADTFVLLDEVQIEKGSNMYRNKMLTWDGKEKFITVCYEKKDCLEKRFKDIELDNSIEWQKRSRDFICVNYKKAKFFDEIWEHVSYLYEKEYKYLHDADMDTISVLRKLLDISTPIVYQSDIEYDREKKKNDMVLEICKSLNADYYLSGNGARKYMDVESFEQEGIQVRYQNFTHPVYRQIGDFEFQPCMSTLDLLFNNGIENSRTIFWNNVKNGKEFEEE